ncbi:GAF domain-containing protein [Nocardia veterana]|uniref:GAF domain-containing protein n=1 Tax=Nocardia veterana TaxID=132249 RepID=UPI001B347104|nr:GAF domain-containing protein [Nocardia veterana]
MSDPVIAWITIETLTSEWMSVASVGDSPREFGAWQRVLQRHLAKMPAVYDGLNTAGIADAINLARSRAEDVEIRIGTRAGPHRLLVKPVFGPAGDVHAIRLWIGPASAHVPPLRPAIGVIWDLASQTLQQPGGVSDLSGVTPEEYVPRLSIAELFNRMSGFNRHAEVLDLLYSPVPGARMQFESTVRFEGQRPARWRLTIRARADERTTGAWLLIEDVSSDDQPAAGPTLEQVGLREAHRRAGTHLAIVQLEYASISHWLTDPAPWVRWDYLFRPVDVFHPDDRERLVRLDERLRAGDTVGMTVRALNYGGGYTPTSLLIYPYPGYSTRQLAIAQLVRAVDDVPVVEPVCAGGISVPRRTPIGYDDQLQRRLTGRRRTGARAVDFPS